MITDPYLKAQTVKLALDLLEEVLSTPPEEDPLYSAGYFLHTEDCLAKELEQQAFCTCNLNMEIVVRRYVPVPGEPPKRF